MIMSKICFIKITISFCVSLICFSNVFSRETEVMSCDATRNGISHSLEIDETDDGVSGFDYESSTPTSGLDLNCTLSSDLVKGTPVKEGGRYCVPNA